MRKTFSPETFICRTIQNQIKPNTMDYGFRHRESGDWWGYFSQSDMEVAPILLALRHPVLLGPDLRCPRSLLSEIRDKWGAYKKRSLVKPSPEVWSKVVASMEARERVLPPEAPETMRITQQVAVPRAAAALAEAAPPIAAEEPPLGKESGKTGSPNTVLSSEAFEGNRISSETKRKHPENCSAMFSEEKRLKINESSQQNAPFRSSQQNAPFRKAKKYVTVWQQLEGLCEAQHFDGVQQSFTVTVHQQPLIAADRTNLVSPEMSQLTPETVSFTPSCSGLGSGTTSARDNVGPLGIDLNVPPPESLFDVELPQPLDLPSVSDLQRLAAMKAAAQARRRRTEICRSKTHKMKRFFPNSLR